MTSETAVARLLPSGRIWFAFLVLDLCANGQEIPGSLAGIVTDAIGGALADAEVVATHTETGAARQSNIALHISDHVPVDFKLSPGDISQSMTEEENAAIVSTENSEQVRELQLNGRSFMSLIELLPGVSSDLRDRVDPSTPPSISINGARNSASAFTIEGGNNSDVIVGSRSRR